ncbi:minor extracellular protease vpr protein [Rhizoctonia solani 123E]|uniref:Minor extracellular protease vpr protein n=1 Tax=Rhizoctonia solani 123E TaxID=1423351 RepID=A0A074S9E7_9AGAM|nr:minor extracellular protease vpr protein [Rhizoctonia solani 123E]
MKVFVACAAAAQLVSAAIDLKSFKHASTAQIVPNSYIVALSRNSHIKRGFASPHEELYHDLRRRGANWEVTSEFSDDLYTGAAVTLGSGADLVKLAEANGVQSITPNYLHSSPKPVSQQVIKDHDGVAPLDVFSTHVMTGVDKLHAEGYLGKGIKIGIIDTGVDYTHPALGGKFGPGNKIIGGYDFVGDAYTGLPGSPPTAPDNDPLDQCNGHGTHVAGIIGANPNNPWNISGVAYKSEINAYRVFGCEGSVPDDILIASLLRASKDGNDVITLSLGGVYGWTESASAVIASKIARKGRIVTIAAGNDGNYGAWYASGPGTGLDVISVGSVDNTVSQLQNAIVSNGRKIPYQSFLPLDIPASHSIYATSNDPTITDDACNPLPSNTPDLSDKLVLIRRGTCSFVTKLDNAAAAGARYFLIYDNQDQPLGAIATGNYTATLVSQSDGLFLLQEAIPNQYTISFPNSPSTTPSLTGGLMSSFSSYGPTYDMYLKPAFSAPGGSILSTYPLPLGGYAILSGTSMATPFAAGSAALLLEARGKNANTAKAARALFQNTAFPVKLTTVNTSLIETAAHQGAGLLNVYDAVKSIGSLAPTELLLNDTANLKDTHTLMLSNHGKESVTYTLTHVPAGTAETINGIEANPGPVPLVSNAATVTIIPHTVTIPAGSEHSIVVTFKPPTGLDPKILPVYSGYIQAAGSDNSTLQSTYLGLAAKLKDAKVIDNTDAYANVKLPVIMDSQGNPVPPEGSMTYTMNGSDTPLVIYRLVMGTPLLRMDLIDFKAQVVTNQHPTLSKRSMMEWLLPFKAKTCGGTFDNVPTLGVLYQQDYAPRNSLAETADDNGFNSFEVTAFANGTAIPDGSYKVLIRALKITGNARVEEDFEVWTSSTVVVKRN